MRNDEIPRFHAPLSSADSAFVVHVTTAPTAMAEGIQGRIEHVTSGWSIRFASVAELIEFMRQSLVQVAYTAEPSANNRDDAPDAQTPGEGGSN